MEHSEFVTKQKAIETILRKHNLGSLLFQRVASFAWITGGAASYVNTATSLGAASILATEGELHIICDNIEASRLEREEKLKDKGFIFHVTPWYTGVDVVTHLAGDRPLGSDAPFPGAVDLGGEIARARAALTPQEGQRFRDLSLLCAESMDRAIRGLQPGQTEWEIAARLAYETQQRGVQAIVNLIATDERIFAYRHPLPTGKQLDRYAMLVLCGRQHGLVCSITRLVHFGRLPEEIRRKAEATARVDAAFITATRPGQPLNRILERAIETYAETGFSAEWQLHHQGGPAAYEPREWVATPLTADPVAMGQVYAWNPSITGTKSEDTILVGENGCEVLTAIPGWPLLPVEVDGVELARPAILEIL